MGAMPPGVRNLFRASLIIFVITVVIGILNGTDIWDPPRNTLLAHVHAGTLGWITLSVFGGAIWMLGDEESNTRTMANYSIAAIAIYVLAFWSVDLTDTVSIQRPIGGILAFIAMVWVFWWALQAMRGKSWNVAEFGMGLALLFLVFGAVLGVLLGLQLAEVEVVAAENADRLAESHPGAMVAGFVVLAALALIEWLIQREVPVAWRGWRGVTGVIQMLLLFVAGVVLVIGFLIDNENLLQAGVPLQILGTIILVIRHWGRLFAPSEWTDSAGAKFVRLPVFGLIIVVALIFYLIGELVGGAEFADIVHVALAFDHINFIMVTTNLIFAMMVMGSKVSDTANRIIFWGTNIGVAGFALGLLLQEDVLKRIFTPILGLALLYGIYTYLTAEEAEVLEKVSA